MRDHENLRRSRTATVSRSTPMTKASPGFNPTDGVRRLSEDVPIRPDTRVLGEQFEDDLNTADHDEEDTVGEEESPACRRHRLTTGT